MTRSYSVCRSARVERRSLAEPGFEERRPPRSRSSNKQREPAMQWAMRPLLEARGLVRDSVEPGHLDRGGARQRRRRRIGHLAPTASSSVPSPVTSPDLKKRCPGPRGRSAPQPLPRRRTSAADVAHAARGRYLRHRPEVAESAVCRAIMPICSQKSLKLDLRVRNAQVQRGKTRASAGAGRIPSAARIAFTTSSCWVVVMVANSGRDTARAP